MTQPETITTKKTETVKEIKEPQKYAVVLFNDDFTPMDFVVSLLCSVFSLSEAKAFEIMMKVHTTGSGVAGIYTLEIAEHRAQKADALATHFQHPFKCEVVPV